MANKAAQVVYATVCVIIDAMTDGATSKVERKKTRTFAIFIYREDVTNEFINGAKVFSHSDVCT